MRQKFTLITLGVRDFKKALAFYENLGWQKSDKSMEEYAFFLKHKITNFRELLFYYRKKFKQLLIYKIYAKKKYPK